MDGWQELFKYLKDRPELLAMVVVIGVLLKIVLVLLKNLTHSMESIGKQSVILAELTTLIKTMAYRRGVEP